GGATLNVAGLSTAFALSSNQTLSNSTSTATIEGNAATGSGALSLTYSSGTPSLAVTGGTLTLSAGTVVKINNLGSVLAAGSYPIIASGVGGSVSGTAPSTVTVAGGGVAAGQPVSLQINNGSLVLVVGSVASPVTITGINISGSTLTLTATNGASGGQFVLLESTNLMLHLGQWTPVITNNFDANGHLNLSTNIVTPGTPQEFYLLQMP
ncbi:MAG TPA: hypothetical protein VMH87_03710, partial [Pseudomonadales bacterium]|nr:hypothetical protein [Pseudomonadales bacterium]